MKQLVWHIVFVVLFFEIGMAGPVYGASFKIASYNVENLFDLNFDATEYPEYHPKGPSGWNQTMLDIKLDHIAEVIADLDVEIIALQEIESKTVLELLQKRLSRRGITYPYAEIADGRKTAVKCAILSTFPVTGKKEILPGHDNERSILRVQLDIEGHPLFLYINHWKSKSGPESKRLKYARALAADMSKLAKDVDFILIGDFNADYNEYITFKDIDRLNDTHGVTGINQIIATVKGGRLIDESLLITQCKDRFLYNLWLEIPETRRWSVNFFGHKNSPDSIILPQSLYDDKGIAYVDNSFDKFDPDYLFDNNKVFRWQRAARGKGRHLGKGYSDHLPIFAKFTTRPFCFASQGKPIVSEPTVLNISDLYGLKKRRINVRIYDAVVIYKQNDNAVIKQKSGRAIYVYKAAKALQYGLAYDLTVTQLNRHYGNMEISGIRNVKAAGPVINLNAYFAADPGLDFSDPDLRNEVIAELSGVYENGWLNYGNDRKIRIYFTDFVRKPQNFSNICLSHVRIGFHRHPEIIVEKMDQVR